MNTEKTVEKIKSCMFDTDTEGDIAKSKMLVDIKVGIKERKFPLELDYMKKRNEILLSEEVQKGKNAEARNALIELELAGTEFDKIKEYDYLLAIIGSVEKHNDNVINLLMLK